jgi:serine/threonine protein kinase
MNVDITHQQYYLETMVSKYAIFYPEGKDKAGFLHMKELGCGVQGSATLVRCMTTKKTVVRKTARYPHDEAYFDNPDVFDFGPELRHYWEHPNINPMISAEGYEDPTEVHSTMIHEYCNGGDLFNFVAAYHRLGMHLPEALIWQFTHQIYSAIHFLHRSMNDTKDPVAHNDLFPGNILVQWPEDISQPPRALLSDLGQAKSFDVDVSKMTVKTEARRLAMMDDEDPPTYEELEIADMQLSVAQDMDDLSALVFFMMTGDRDDRRCDQKYNLKTVASNYSPELFRLAMKIFHHSRDLECNVATPDAHLRDLVAKRAAGSACTFMELSRARPITDPTIELAFPMLFDTVQDVLAMFPRPPGPWEIIKVDGQSFDFVEKVEIGFPMCANRVFYTDLNGMEITGRKPDLNPEVAHRATGVAAVEDIGAMEM